MKWPAFILFSSFSFFVSAQGGLPIGGDLNTAVKLQFLVRKCSYGPTVAPKGAGKVNEIKACDKEDVFTFEKEHNSAWYFFTAPEDGDLIFEIMPENPKNDYDFMLYRWKDTSFASELKKRNMLPVRTNLARSGKEGVSFTGLSYFGTRNHVPVGPGESFSAPLSVKKGESFILVIDNVYPKGKGHTVNISFLREISISGKVQYENKKSASALVTIEDREGKIIAQTETDNEGNYKLNARILDTENYTLIYDNDSSFANCMEINSTYLSKTNYVLKDIKTTLQKLSGGGKYVIGAVDFQNGTSQLHPTAVPALNTIVRMMLQNPAMTIQVEGHVNNYQNQPNNTGADHQLAEERAKAVYDKLLSLGVEKERISYISYGSLYMIYPKAYSQKEIDTNNRIEIFVTKK